MPRIEVTNSHTFEERGYVMIAMGDEAIRHALMRARKKVAEHQRSLQDKLRGLVAQQSR